MTAAINSITKHLDPRDIANEARMLRGSVEKRAGFQIAIVIVEGSTDQLMYTTILDATKCIIISAFGKTNAIQAVEILINDNVHGVVGVVDDDYDRLEGRSIRNDFIAVSDTHDLETLLIVSTALEKLLSTLLLPRKRHYLQDFTNSVRTKLVELGSPLGYIRWLSNHENFLLDFRKVCFGTFIDNRNLTIDIHACIDEIMSHNRGCIVSVEEIRTKVIEHMKIQADPWLLCQGHDLIKILTFIIPRMLPLYAPTNRDDSRVYFARITQKIPSEDRVTEQLIMCYEQDEFRKTNMYSDMREWEKRNPHYQVVRS